MSPKPASLPKQCAERPAAERPAADRLAERKGAWDCWYATPDEVPEIQERAVELALRGVQLDPESAIAHSVPGVFRMIQFDWIGAEQAHRRATALLGDRSTASRYGVLLLRSGRLAAAQEQYEMATTLEPMGGRPVPF